LQLAHLASFPFVLAGRAKQRWRPTGMTNGAVKAEKEAVDTVGLQTHLRKTKLCTYFIQKRCTKGDQCTFAHSVSEMKHVPDLEKTQLCKDFLSGMCLQGDECRFAHDKTQLRANPVYHKQKLCNWYKGGRCMNGSACNFAHGERDLNLNKGKKKSHHQQQISGYADVSASRAQGGQVNSPRPASSTTGGTSDSSDTTSVQVPLSAPPGLMRPSTTNHLPWKVASRADEPSAKYSGDLEILKLCAVRIAMRIKMEEEEQQAQVRIREDFGLFGAQYISTRGMIA